MKNIKKILLNGREEKMEEIINCIYCGKPITKKTKNHLYHYECYRKINLERVKKDRIRRKKRLDKWCDKYSFKFLR